MTQHAAAFGGLDTESDALPPDHPTTLFHLAKRLSSMYMVLIVVLHDSWVKTYIVSSLCLRLTQPLTQQIVRSIRLALGFNVRQIFMLSYGSSVPLFLIPSSI